MSIKNPQRRDRKSVVRNGRWRQVAIRLDDCHRRCDHTNNCSTCWDCWYVNITAGKWLCSAAIDRYVSRSICFQTDLATQTQYSIGRREAKWIDSFSLCRHQMHSLITSDVAPLSRRLWRSAYNIFPFYKSVNCSNITALRKPHNLPIKENICCSFYFL